MFYQFRLQVKESWVIPNVLGNCNMPVHSYKWTDSAVGNDIDGLQDLKSRYEKQGLECRIWDCRENTLAK